MVDRWMARADGSPIAGAVEMTELKFYRWIMGCLVLLAIGVGVKRYGDYRVNEFLSREAPGGVVAAAGYGGPGGREGGHSLPQI